MLKTHTPGPWLADSATRIQANGYGSRYDICRLCDIPPHIANHDKRRNARLIAESPAMLEVCRSLLKWAARSGDRAELDDLISDARASVARVYRSKQEERALDALMVAAMAGIDLDAPASAT